MNGKCLECKESINLKVAGDTYWCVYCELPICRRTTCLDLHTPKCRAEREAMMGDTAIMDKESHWNVYALRRARERYIE